MKHKFYLAILLAGLMLQGCSRTESNKTTNSTDDKSGTNENSKDVTHVGIEWVKNTDGISFEKVKELAAAQNKKIFIDYYTKW